MQINLRHSGRGQTVVVQSGQSFALYLTKQTDFWGIGRSGLDIPDVHGNNAKILPSYATFEETSFLSLAITGFASTVYSGFIEAYCYIDQTNTLEVFNSCDPNRTTRYFQCNVQADGRVAVGMREPVTSPFTNVYRTTDPVAVGWHTIKWVASGTDYSILIDGVATAGGMVSGTDQTKWIGHVMATAGLRTNIGIGIRKTSSPIYSPSGKIAWVNFNDTNKWYLTGQGLYEYDNTGGIHLPWVGTPLHAYGIQGSQFYLDYGYTLYTKAEQLNEYVPNSALNTPIAIPSGLSTYTKIVDRNGSVVKHNLAPSVIDFDYTDATPVGVKYLDRSNATYYADAARTGHDYDAANVYQWKSEDIADPTVYYTWLNADYKSKVISRITQQDLVILTLDEILALK